jgi:hypothetical protein
MIMYSTSIGEIIKPVDDCTALQSHTDDAATLEDACMLASNLARVFDVCSLIPFVSGQ